VSLEELLRFAKDQGASDLHLKPMRPPLLRIKGKLLPVKGDPLKPEQIEDLVMKILTPPQVEKLNLNQSVDLGYGVKGVARFRGNIYFQRGTISASFRQIPYDIQNIADLNLPEVLYEFCKIKTGLVLVTGATGMGKSTTLAAIIKEIVASRHDHVITIEDPIEFLFSDNKATISQREVGTDTPSFKEALRNAMRQDPDVIMVGEMRDRETISTVLTAAETGHLVFSTLHTNSSAQTIDRIIDAFPSDQQDQIRSQLGQVLRAIVSLKLVPRRDGKGMVAATEIMKNTPKITKSIEEGDIKNIHEEIEGSVAHFRMQSLNQSLIALLVNQVIDYETAMDCSPESDDLSLKLRKLFPHLEQRKEAVVAPSDADFSEVQKLMGIKKLYEEQEEKFRLQMSEKDEIIQQMEEDLQRLRAEIQDVGGASGELRAEIEKLKRANETMDREYQGKLKQLQERIRTLNNELTEARGGSKGDESKSGGFFRR